MMGLDKITENLLKTISDFTGEFKGAFSIRSNGQCAARQSTANIKIESKKDAPGLEIHIKPGTKGESVYIPACVTKAGIDDLVYNDFYVGEDADVVIIAGCGVHSEEDGEARHNGIHRFFLGKGSHVVYQEKHIGTGTDSGDRRIDPVTDAYLEEDSTLEMDTVQLGGVHSTVRNTTATLAARSKLLVRERLLTDGDDVAESSFVVNVNGEDAGVDLISRSVAKGHSRQSFHSNIRGRCRCTGHSECDAILADEGVVIATPALEASHVDAALIHEAAIGKIAGEQLLKLCTLGLTPEEAEQRIIQGFLK